MPFNSSRYRCNAVAALAALLLLTACGSLPKPFAHRAADPANPLTSLRDGGGLRIAPVSGVNDDLASSLAEALAAELQILKIPAVADPKFAGRYVLSGHRSMLAKAPDGAATAKIVWTLFDTGGAVVGEVDQTVRGAAVGWEIADPALVDVVARDAAPAISRFISERVSRAALSVPSFVVMKISGAPGDGPESLKRALDFHLKRKGYKTVGEEASAAFRVIGAVSLTPADTQQRIEIMWRVQNEAGRELGKVRQANSVPVGALDGRWGELAFAVAAGAVDGITQIVRGTDVSAR